MDDITFQQLAGRAHELASNGLPFTDGLRVMLSLLSPGLIALSLAEHRGIKDFTSIEAMQSIADAGRIYRQLITQTKGDDMGGKRLTQSEKDQRSLDAFEKKIEKGIKEQLRALKWVSNPKKKS